MITQSVDVLKQTHLLLGGHVIIASLGALALRGAPYGELTVHVELLKDILLAHTYKVFTREHRHAALALNTCMDDKGEEEPSWKIKAATLNLWIILESLVRNWDWGVTLPSIIQLGKDRTF